MDSTASKNPRGSEVGRGFDSRRLHDFTEGELNRNYFYSQEAEDGGHTKPLGIMTKTEIAWRLRFKKEDPHMGSMDPDHVRLLEYILTLSDAEWDLVKLVFILEK